MADRIRSTDTAAPWWFMQVDRPGVEPGRDGCKVLRWLACAALMMPDALGGLRPRVVRRGLVSGRQARPRLGFGIGASLGLVRGLRSLAAGLDLALARRDADRRSKSVVV